VVNEIKLVDPEILYEVSRDGHNNLEGIGSADTTKAKAKDSSKAIRKPAALALKSFMIENGRVRYRDSQEWTRAHPRQDQSERVPRSGPAPGGRDHQGQAGDLRNQGLRFRFRPAQGNIKITVRHEHPSELPGERLQVRSLSSASRHPRHHQGRGVQIS